jgi:hypothetical protein
MYYTIDGKYVNKTKTEYINKTKPKYIEKFNNLNKIVEHNTEQIAKKCIGDICISENDVKIIKSNNNLFMKDALDNL